MSESFLTVKNSHETWHIRREVQGVSGSWKLNHSAEPWSVREDGRILGSDGSPICYGNDWDVIFHNPEDARRIVACVNACRGVSTDELEAKAKQ